VLNLGGADIQVFNNRFSNYISLTTPGQPIGMFYGYKVIGIYKNQDDILNYKDSKGQTVVPFSGNTTVASNLGHYIFKDVNDDGKIDSQDVTAIGNPHPNFTGGINIQLSYGNFDLSSFLYASVGNDIFKYYEVFAMYGQLNSNILKERATRSWSPSNPNGDLSMWTGLSTGEDATCSHSKYVEDGSYLRMQNLSVGYNLPRKWVKFLGLSRLRVYAQVMNLFTITGYSGLDPEVRMDDGNYDRDKGIDMGTYGMPRMYNFGVNVSF
jgi:hypothetical protein